jgi:ATP-binding cassette subfamily B protein
MQGMLVREILSKEYAGLRGYHSGELVNRVFSDMSVIKNGIMNILPNLISIVVSFVGAAAILIAMDWHFVILMIAGGTLGLILIILFRGPMKRRHKRMQEAEGALHASTQETQENIRFIKASVSESRAINRIEGYQKTLNEEQVRQGIFSFRMNDSMGLVFDFRGCSACCGAARTSTAAT